MRWYEIPEDKAMLIIERRKRGESFSRIGQDLRIDRRIVAKVVRGYEERLSGRVMIRHGELGQVFRNHLKDMREAATLLLVLAAPPSVRGTFLPGSHNVEVALARVLPTTLAHLFVGLPHTPETARAEEADAELGLREAVEQRLANRRAGVAVEGLKEHTPALVTRLEEWKEIAEGYGEIWQQLAEYASSSGIDPKLLEATVGRALDRVAPSGRKEGPRCPTVPGRTADRTEQCVKVLFQKPTGVQLVQTLANWLHQLDAAYENLEELLGPPLLDNALVTGRCRFCPVP